MYQRILIPLDGSSEPEHVVPVVERELAPDGEVVLLMVTPPRATKRLGGHVFLGSQQQEADQFEALAYLKGVIRGQEVGRGQWRCETTVSESVAEAIVNTAGREGVELIAMYTHDRKGLSKLVRGNVAREVERIATVEVKTFTDSELASAPVDIRREAVAGTISDKHEATLAKLKLANYEGVDIFADLSKDQIDRVVSLAERLSLSPGEALGTGGELGQRVFIILGGEAQLSAHSEVGEITIRAAGPGESFPLAAILGTGQLITSGEATTDMEVLAIPRSELLDLCEAEPEIGSQIYRAVARLFAQRYNSTLAHLAISAEREMRHGPTQPDSEA